MTDRVTDATSSGLPAPFDGGMAHELDAVREALVLTDDVPVLAIDARSRPDVKRTLIELVLHTLQGAG